jgi:broad specificity phosphatase PhoE
MAAIDTKVGAETDAKCTVVASSSVDYSLVGASMAGVVAYEAKEGTERPGVAAVLELAQKAADGNDGARKMVEEAIKAAQEAADAALHFACGEQTSVGAPKRGNGSCVKTLVLIRHAESMANARDRMPKETPDEIFHNTPLTDEGKAQAAKIRGSVQLLIVSPLKRTLQTYAHSGLRVGRLITTELAREWCHYGNAGEFEMEPSRKESWGELCNRVERLITFIRDQPERDIGILAHGVLFGQLIDRLKRRDAAPHGFHNGQVVTLRNVDLSPKL